MQINTKKLEWIKTNEQMPDIGQKIVVFLWMDEAVSQAWWNGEHYVLVDANDEGIAHVYEVSPTAISHWQDMPTIPSMTTQSSKNYGSNVVRIH